MWDAVGCIKQYHMNEVNERISYLKRNQYCFKCGSKYKYSKFKTHKCRWIGSKLEARCKAFDCKYAAYTFPDHSNIDNTLPELKFWLGKNNIRVPTAVDTARNDVKAKEVPTDGIPLNSNKNYSTIGKKNGKPPLANHEESL